jgi:putative ABC transport system permease protein
MNMGIRPILSALLRNSAGAILVSLQIAITLAIVVNAVYLTTQRVQLVGRPSGIDDQNIFSFNVEGFEKDFDFIGMVRDDMALLRQMPGRDRCGTHSPGTALGQRQFFGLLLAARQEG